MGSMTPHQILWDLSQADGERLENTWWITTANETGKNQLRHTRKAKPVNVSDFMAKRH
jgi:hypothetical protein